MLVVHKVGHELHLAHAGVADDGHGLKRTAPRVGLTFSVARPLGEAVVRRVGARGLLLAGTQHQALRGEDALGLGADGHLGILIRVVEHHVTVTIGHAAELEHVREDGIHAILQLFCEGVTVAVRVGIRPHVAAIPIVSLTRLFVRHTVSHRLDGFVAHREGYFIRRHAPCVGLAHAVHRPISEG